MSDWFQFSQKFHILTLHCLCFQVNVATQCDPDEIIVLSDSEWPSTSLRTTDCSTCHLYSRISWKRSFLRTVLVCWLVKIFFFFFFKFLLNWMWFKQPLTGVEKQGKLWIWYIVLVNYILPNKSPSACKGLRYNCTLSFKRQLIKLDICFLENQGFGSLLLLQLCASQRTADVDADCLLSVCGSGNDLSRLGDPNFSCRVFCRSLLHD